MSQKTNPPPKHRLQLVKSDLTIRDNRWSIHIDGSECPVGVWVKHRKHGDFYDWPEDACEKVKAAGRAYDIHDEIRFYTQGKAVAAALGFLKAYGSGEVEWLEWDVNSQTRVVTQHCDRGPGGMFWPAAKPDALDQFIKGAAK